MIIGIVANVLNSIAIIPEVRNVVKSWDASEMSYSWLILSLIANLMWILYGLKSKSMQIAFMGVTFSAFYGLHIFIKMNPNFKKKED